MHFIVTKYTVAIDRSSGKTINESYVLGTYKYEADANLAARRITSHSEEGGVYIETFGVVQEAEETEFFSL